MANKIKSRGVKKSGGLESPQTLEAIQKSVADLYEVHEGEIRKVLNESETKKVSVTFGVEIDESESEHVVEIRMRFSQCVTDCRTNKIDDPNQPPLFAADGVEAKPKSRKRGKDAAAGEDASGED